MEPESIARISATPSTLSLVNSYMQRYYLHHSHLKLMLENLDKLVWIQWRDISTEKYFEPVKEDVVGMISIEPDVVSIVIHVGPHHSEIGCDPRTGRLSNISESYLFSLPRGDFNTIYAALELMAYQRDKFYTLFPTSENNGQPSDCFPSLGQQCEPDMLGEYEDNNPELLEEREAE